MRNVYERDESIKDRPHCVIEMHLHVDIEGVDPTVQDQPRDRMALISVIGPVIERFLDQRKLGPVTIGCTCVSSIAGTSPREDVELPSPEEFQGRFFGLAIGFDENGEMQIKRLPMPDDDD